jgi:hypothetical protein
MVNRPKHLMLSFINNTIYFSSYFSDRKHEESIKTYSIRIIRMMENASNYKGSSVMKKTFGSLTNTNAVTLQHYLSVLMCLRHSYESKILQ